MSIYQTRRALTNKISSKERTNQIKKYPFAEIRSDYIAYGMTLWYKVCLKAVPPPWKPHSVETENKNKS